MAKGARGACLCAGLSVLTVWSLVLPAHAAGVWLGGGSAHETVSAQGYSQPNVSCTISVQSTHNGNTISWAGAFLCDQVLGTTVAEKTVDYSQSGCYRESRSGAETSNTSCVKTYSPPGLLKKHPGTIHLKISLKHDLYGYPIANGSTSCTWLNFDQAFDCVFNYDWTHVG